MNAIQRKLFNDINLEDKFFDSLRESYPGFDEWFKKKSDAMEYAYILIEEGVQGFLYLKEECDLDESVVPILEAKKRLKVGTFKINAHGTKLGERFVKIIIDQLFQVDYIEAYVTIFDEHKTLIKLLEKYGFKYHGEKKSVAGKENVYLKSKENITKDIFKDYPRIHTNLKDKYLLAIWPVYHTRMFPDSRLNTERDHVVEDESVTNSIEKIYLSGADRLQECERGDVLVLYRTGERGKLAEYSAVATSICVIDEIRHISEFESFDEFKVYCGKNSVFSIEELECFWEKRRYRNIVKVLYNIALNNRITRHDLIERVGISRKERIVLYKLDDEEFNRILELGGVNEDIIID